MPSPHSAPAERFAALLRWLGYALDTRYHAGILAAPLFILLQNRIRVIKLRFVRLAARLAAGNFVPRKSSGPRPGRPQGRKNLLPSGPCWLIKMVPEAAASASQLRILLADPEMAALLAAAPASAGRPIRSLCRMLGVEIPPILAPPPSTRPKKPRKPRARIPERERGYSRRYPAGRPRYIMGIRAPWPSEKTS
jgi:hypothetical protein